MRFYSRTARALGNARGTVPSTAQRHSLLRLETPYLDLGNVLGQVLEAVHLLDAANVLGEVVVDLSLLHLHVEDLLRGCAGEDLHVREEELLGQECFGGAGILLGRSPPDLTLLSHHLSRKSASGLSRTASGIRLP